MPIASSMPWTGNGIVLGEHTEQPTVFDVVVVVVVMVVVMVVGAVIRVAVIGVAVIV
jgi:hypothetical protein